MANPQQGYQPQSNQQKQTGQNEQNYFNKGKQDDKSWADKSGKPGECATDLKEKDKDAESRRASQNRDEDVAE